MKVLIAALMLVVIGCATSFRGSPRVEGGVNGCKAKCTEWGLEMAGMVQLGGYSDACVCEVSGRGKTANAGLATGSVAAVILQTQRAQATAHRAR